MLVRITDPLMSKSGWLIISRDNSTRTNQSRVVSGLRRNSILTTRSQYSRITNWIRPGPRRKRSWSLRRVLPKSHCWPRSIALLVGLGMLKRRAYSCWCKNLSNLSLTTTWGLLRIGSLETSSHSTQLNKFPRLIQLVLEGSYQNP